MIVAISGSRTFLDRALVEKVVDRLLERGGHIHVGDAPNGVDKFVSEYLSRLNPQHDLWTQFFANWTAFGRAAGHERNGRVLGDARLLIAIYADGELTPGTSDAVVQARRRRIPMFVYHEGRWLAEGVMPRKANLRRLLTESDLPPETTYNPPPPPNGKP